ncbi:PfkB family carbohydrate kinase, partial [Trabulsiella odontotermitis]|uniref:PfkB family carbohydrate kinase n=1 Tax=Trabulsiella odontotermitis TaxID=379893 RepID=UPI0006A21661
MKASGVADKLRTLDQQRPVTVIGAAVIDVIADAYALPWRGCDIELKQQSVNIGGCALNIAVALKRLGITACNALPLGQGVWAEIICNNLAREGLVSAIDNATGDNGWCLALVEPDGERTFMSFDFGPRIADIPPALMTRIMACKPLVSLNRQEAEIIAEIVDLPAQTEAFGQAWLTRYGAPLIVRHDKDGAWYFTPEGQ